MRLPGVLGVVGVIILTLIGCGPVGVSADEGGQLSMKEARKEIAQRRREWGLSRGVKSIDSGGALCYTGMRRWAE